MGWLTLLALWLGGTALFWRKWWVLAVSAFVALLALIVSLAPGPAPDATELQGEYLRCLRRYEGTYYVWGGEAPTGIDCSGLVRTAMVDSLLRLGVQHGNAAVIRQGLSLWWHDGSAREFGAGYGGRMTPILETRAINHLDHSLLSPGDVAVTESGLHTMAYLGQNVWIEADTGPMRVIAASAPGKLPWFDVGMRIMRWRQLQ